MLTLFLSYLILSTNCVQTFEFIGSTTSNAGVPTLWILEHVAGECYSSKLIQVSIYDSLLSYSESNYAKHNNVELFKKSFSEFERLPTVELQKLRGAFGYSGTGKFRIKEAVDDISVLTKYFNDGIMKYPHPLVHPIFEGVQGKYLFSYTPGLYINYRIQKAIYLPTKRILVVFTNHSLLSSGGDSMHGFIIYSI